MWELIKDLLLVSLGMGIGVVLMCIMSVGADEDCVTGLSDNIVLYGHNMKNGSMFSDLVKYASKDFLELRFNEYTDMDEDENGRFVVVAKRIVE